jgi:hypothetical protein
MSLTPDDFELLEMLKKARTEKRMSVRWLWIFWRIGLIFGILLPFIIWWEMR